MYIPTAFRESRSDVLHAFIRRHPFATLVSNGASGSTASHVPLVFDPTRGAQGALRGHLARPNAQWQDFVAGAELLVIFHGPHAYVSPAWYATAKPSVPTWNYVAVHVYGRARILEGDELRRHLLELVATFESGQRSPWDPNRLPADYLDAMQRGVVGFEIEIARLEGKWKLNQNRAAEDRLAAADALAATGDPDSLEIARLMRGATEAKK
jgi:transcriptional regulator